jgi:DNA (cytosine-5)-methyltransferase 1
MKKIQKVPLLPQVGSPNQKHVGLIKSSGEDKHAVVYAVDQGGGKSSCNIIEDKSPTLTCTHGGEPAIYAIDRETFNCGQNFARNLGISEDGIASTLNAQGPSAVAEPISFYPQMKAESQSPREGIANTIVNGTNPGFQNGIVEPKYTVRRLTPLECAKLQGFPDFWCSNLGIKNPTDEDISFWTEVFETHRLITGTSSKPKSKIQIIKWLKDPHSDSAEYRMWGNGVALPCVRFILGSIANFMHNK